MLIEHVTQNLIKTIKKEEIRSALEEAVTIFDDVRAIHECLLSLQAEEISEEDATYEIESLAVFTLDNLAKFSSWRSSANDIVNKYLERVLLSLETLEKNLNVAMDSMFLLDAEELDTMIDCAYRVASGFLFFCLVEFNLFALEKETEDIDEIVDAYCSFSCVSPVEFATRLIGYADKYKIKIELFDANPELEDTFYKYMGPYIVGVQTEYVTLDMVKQLVNGEIMPEDVIAMTVKLAGEVEEELMEEN